MQWKTFNNEKPVNNNDEIFNKTDINFYKKNNG